MFRHSCRPAHRLSTCFWVHCYVLKGEVAGGGGSLSDGWDVSGTAAMGLPLPVHTATPTRGYGIVTITKQVKKNTIFYEIPLLEPELSPNGQ